MKIFNYINRLSSVRYMKSKKGMEMVQVAILIALAVALGIIFRTEITKFVNNTFSQLNA
ncbi:MAG: Flp1 family type IVb pilin [Eubacteriales bacterium]|nr:Flp1 family type IVb pilin [Eubacteriales bacterium]